MTQLPRDWWERSYPSEPLLQISSNLQEFFHELNQADMTHICPSDLSRKETGWHRLELVHPESLKCSWGRNHPLVMTAVQHRCSMAVSVSHKKPCAMFLLLLPWVGSHPCRKLCGTFMAHFLCCPRGIQQMQGCNGRDRNMAEPYQRFCLLKMNQHHDLPGWKTCLSQVPSVSQPQLRKHEKGQCSLYYSTWLQAKDVIL